MNIETTRTATHEFYINEAVHKTPVPAFEVIYRSLNPKNGKPWQAPKYVIDGGDVTPTASTVGRPFLFSTLAAARVAVEGQKVKFAKRGRA